MNFDTAEHISHELAAHLASCGTKYIGVYARTDRANKDVVDAIHAAGIKVFAVFEKGRPVVDSYFSATQADTDAKAALAWAEAVGMPTSAPMFFAVDEDADPAAVKQYFVLVHDAMKEKGYLTGAYGAGDVLIALMKSGFIHFAWLAQSKGWEGYKAEIPRDPDIIQGEATTYEGLSVDEDIINHPAVCW